MTDDQGAQPPGTATGAGAAAAAAAAAPTSAPATTSTGAGTVVRRIVLFTLLFSLVAVGATGFAGLLDRVVEGDRLLVADDAGLARSLAFTFIGIPLAAVLWWWQRRRLAASRGERASLVWALYVAAMSLTSLIVTTVGLGSAAAAGVDARWVPGDLASGLVWAGVWLWHRSMWRSRAISPTRLADLPVELGALWGLVVASVSAIVALTAVLSEALSGAAPVLVSSRPWYIPALQALVWFTFGLVIWWWHWYRERADRAPGGFAAVLLVVVVGGGAATTLFALGTVLFVLLRLLFSTDPIAEVLDPLDVAIASALVGAAVWIYHATALAVRSEQTQRAGRLVVSAVALIGAASGFGVVVNALLATLASALAGDPQTLLFGGLSALVVGGPAWWLAWRPDRPSTADAADPARRVYLVTVFGASAIVAVVTLLLIGYRVFEFALGTGGFGSLVERIREPLGLLSATALVFGYHFAVWRHDRAVAPKAARRLARVILVASGDVDGQAARIRAATGAAVTVWRAADDAAEAAPFGDEHVQPLLTALEAVGARRVLVVAEQAGGVRVIPLAE